MNKIFYRKCFRRYVPANFQNYLKIQFQDKFLKNLRKDILKHFKNKLIDSKDPDLIDALNFLKQNPLHIYPHNFIKKYKSENIVVYHENKSNLNYVMTHHKKLFYPMGWNSETVSYSHSFSCLEQDKQSPHCYFNHLNSFNKNDIVVDAGAAEGNFSLEIIEKVKKVYLCECSDAWQGPLKKTLEPWREKIEIIPKKVSCLDNSEFISIDRFFQDKEPPTVIKIDVDGDEKNLLKGAKDILNSSKELKIALCVYHKKNDESEFKSILQGFGFNVFSSKGYMIFYPDEPLAKPYFRRGLIFGTK